LILSRLGLNNYYAIAKKDKKLFKLYMAVFKGFIFGVGKNTAFFRKKITKGVDRPN
jgi:hypothetical protein